MADEELSDDLEVEVEATEGLPAFEGTVPIGVVSKLSGTGDRIAQARHIGDRVVLLVEAEVDRVSHDQTKAGLVRVQRFAVLDLYELDATGQGLELLRAERTRYRLADEAARGLTPLDFDDTTQPQQYVADAGVVLTPKEIALARGLTADLPALLTVVFDDGDRYFWPDDWEGTAQTLATVGGLMRTPALEPGERHQVVEWLDAETGATLDKWTDEDEAARLAFVETDLEASEALEQDLAAVAQLEDARRLRGSQSVVEQTAAGEPWSGYDDRAAAGLRTTISQSDDLELLQRAFAYELAHKNRRTVCVAFEARLEALTPATEGGDDAAS